MIKINLLKNDLSMHAQREVSALGTESATEVIQLEAMRSSRRVYKFMIVFVILIGAAVTGYLYRYPIVEFVEQYTGPLNLLPPQVKPLTQEEIEQLRQKKRRDDYMRNSLMDRERDYTFLHSLDTSNANNPAVWLASVDVDGNDFTLDMFGKTENDLKAFSNFITQLPVVKNRDAKDVRSSSAIPGYSFRRQMLGALVVSQTNDEDTTEVHVSFADVKKAHQMVQTMAKKKLPKVTAEAKESIQKGVDFDAYAATIKIEASSAEFLRFLKDLKGEKMNFEFSRYTINYTVQTNPSRPKPDIISFEYNVLTPAVRAAAKTDTTRADTTKKR